MIWKNVSYHQYLIIHLTYYLVLVDPADLGVLEVSLEGLADPVVSLEGLEVLVDPAVFLEVLEDLVVPLVDHHHLKLLVSLMKALRNLVDLKQKLFHQTHFVAAGSDMYIFG
jgi:hypothetical protein